MGAQVKTKIDSKPSAGILEKLVSPSRWDEMSKKKKKIISQKVDGGEVASFSARKQ